MTRLRIPGALAAGQAVAVEDTQARHLVVVLRARAGDRVELVAGDGGRWQGRVRSTAPLSVEVLAPIAGPSADLQGRLEVWAPLLKGGKTDDLVRQLTELGATSIVCFEATRSVARLAPAKVAGRVARWETIAQEATRQCGRVEVPTVAHCPQLPDDGPGVYLWEDGGASASEVLGGWGTVPLRILVGPEGGLDTVDAAALDAAGWTPASLGPRVLRAETAVVAAATLGLVALGEAGYGFV